MARELPSGLELVRHGGLLCPEPARGVGAGAGRATRRGHPCAPRAGPEASRSQPVQPEETTDARARALLSVVVVARRVNARPTF